MTTTGQTSEIAAHGRAHWACGQQLTLSQPATILGLACAEPGQAQCVSYRSLCSIRAGNG